MRMEVPKRVSRLNVHLKCKTYRISFVSSKIGLIFRKREREATMNFSCFKILKFNAKY